MERFHNFNFYMTLYWQCQLQLANLQNILSCFLLYYIFPGKKWRSMGAEKQDKYRQQYAKLREEYVAKLERFYEKHPDAKPSAFR